MIKISISIKSVYWLLQAIWKITLDTETFYSFYYTNIIPKSNRYLPQISEDMATIIISKVTDRLLLKSKSGNENLPELDKTDTAQDLSENEIRGLCYVTEYILHKLFAKMKNSPK